MELLSKIPDIAKLPTKYFAVAAVVMGAVLFLPKSFLDRLNLGQIPAPYGIAVGLAFLVCCGVVVVNSVGWLASRRDAGRRATQRNLELFAKLENLDNEERAILREFIVFRRSTIGLPVDNPAVAGLRVSGVIRVVGKLGKGSRFGVFFPFQLTRDADALISDEMLGVPWQFLLQDDNGRRQLSGDGQRWLVRSRPAFAEGIDKFDGEDHRTRWK
jgi:hypothetical protein